MSDADGWLYDSVRDRFFSDMDEALDWYKGNELVPPDAFALCEQEGMHISADDIVHSALEDHHEDSESEIDQAEIKRLQALLDEWCEKQGIVSWFPTTTLVPVPRGAK